MVCERCNQRPATVQYTVVHNTEGKRANLCAQCAKELGILSGMGDSFGSFVNSFFQSSLLGNRLPTAFTAVSPGMPALFPPQTGDPAAQPRLPSVHTLLDNLTAQTPCGPGCCGCADEGDATSPQLQALQQQLDQAVAAQDFERAAQLRDEIAKRRG